MIAGIAVLCLVDMWMVNKRYLYDDMFVDKIERDAPQQMTETDKIICRDKALDYRVLNLASNTFNENETSYYHKSIGGYHPAKLRRYQEMIDAHIAPEMQKTMQAVAAAGGDMTKVNGDSIFPVLNMLNTKYFIMPLQGGQTVPVQNPYAYGNAWFVDEVKYVNNANEEIDGVGKVNLRHVAVADAKFKEQLDQSVKQDDTSVVKMIQYKPNNLTYEVKSSKGGVIVFSEIYYPGWTATVDGQPVELGRVNYILRALNVKAGSHKVVLDFHPQSLKNTETVAYIGYGVLVLLIIIGIVSGSEETQEGFTGSERIEGSKLKMLFRTEIEIPKADFEIEPAEQMLFVGSCFADNLGSRFVENRFRATVNPFGVMYNPASILHTVREMSLEVQPRVAVFTLGTNHVYILKETGEIVDNCQKRPQRLFEERELSVEECAGYLQKAVDLLKAVK